VACVSAGALGSRAAHGQMIKQPGNHPIYSVELEPHLVVQWDRGWHTRSAGAGPGFRASIPFVRNGPVPQINNNIGISFGVDWAYFSSCDGQPNSADCHVSELWFPVLAQWNFFFTPIVSAFGELGGAMVSRSFVYGRGCPQLNEADCNYSNFDVFQPVFYVGGRFLFAPTIGMVVRLGTPSMTIGADFLL
jgi:hypothetical protein